MSDNFSDPVELLTTTHKREKKELQARIQKIKHEVPKGDKKKKKESVEQIAKLQAEFDQRQDKEMADLQQSLTLSDKVGELSVSEASSGAGCGSGEATLEETGDVNTTTKKQSKAQKRRDKKMAKEHARDDEIKQQAVDNLSGSRHVETQKIKSLLKSRGLQIKDIKSDGNCLYNAINHQLIKCENPSSNEELRASTANYFRDNADDIMPFLVKDDGNPFTLEDFAQYCLDTETTTAWGGHHEIRALSHVLKQPIEIIQGEGPPIKIGEEFESQPPIVLCYHRHAFGLGEHYNSVEDYVEEEKEEEEDV